VTYDINDELAIGVRAEWFKVRPEIRYDWADENVFNGSVDHDQVAIAMDMILTF